MGRASPPTASTTAARGALVLGALTRQNRDAIRQILGFHDPTDDPDFDAAAPGSIENIEEWRAEIQRLLLARSAAEWVDQFVAAGVPASVVQFAEEMASDPQVVATGMMVDLEHDITGPQQVVGPLVRMSASPTAARRAAPPLGAHSREVLLEAGLTPLEVDALAAARVIPPPG
ncbi:MAG TPA: CoA transferase [Tepidiformaceae bacterium]|nr:CoA transferase [Tepidiformaceae bacterium]